MEEINVFPHAMAMYGPALQELRNSFDVHLKSDCFRGLKAIREDAGLTLAGHETFASLHGVVGVLRIEGVITPRQDFFSFLFGGAPLDVIIPDFKALLADDKVAAIVLKVDSSGGLIVRVQEFAELVFASREIKPIITISEDIIASAAAFIGMAAGHVLIASETVLSGSIGTVLKHKDLSKQNEMVGVKVTSFESGSDKGLGSPDRPLSDQDKALLQAHVDFMGEIIVSSVARYRGLDTAGAGAISSAKVFIGKQGIEAGLVDGVMTFDDLLGRLNASGGNVDVGFFNNNDNGRVKVMAVSKPEITVDKMKQDHPEVYGEIMGLGAVEANRTVQEEVSAAKEAGHAAGVVVGKAEATTGERLRIAAVMEQVEPGMEEIIKNGIETGMSAGDVAMAIGAKRRVLLKEGYSEMQSQSSGPLNLSNEGQGESGESKLSFNVHVDTYMSTHKCNKRTAMSACVKLYPDEYKLYKSTGK